MKLSKAFGSALREKRNAKDLSQETLAHEAGVDRTFIGRLERGERQPTLATIFALAKSLGCRPADLILSTERFLLKK